MRQVAVTMIGIVAILWGGLMVLFGLVGLAVLGDPFSAFLLFIGTLAAALGIVAIRRFG